MATIAIPHNVPSKDVELPALIGLAVVGGAIGLGVISLDGFGRPGQTVPLKPGPAESQGYVFSHLGEFRMWVFLIGVQTALWAIGAAILLSPDVRGPIDHFWRAARAQVAASLVAVAVPLLAFVFYVTLDSHIRYRLPWHQEKVLALSLIAVAIALLGVAELALVRFALQSEEPSRGTLEELNAYLALRAVLQRILAVLGAIIGAAVLAAGGLRNAVVAYDAVLKNNGMNVHGPFPREYVLIYGAFFTVVLALIYAPVYLRLLEVGRAHVEAVCKAEEPKSASWEASYEKRKKLEEYLQLDVATSASFRAGVSILAPLASALVALLLGAA
jgi:hypothetical protein